MTTIKSMEQVINQEISGAKALLTRIVKQQWQYASSCQPIPNGLIVEARRVRRYIRIMNNIALGVHRV